MDEFTDIFAFVSVPPAGGEAEIQLVMADDVVFRSPFNVVDVRRYGFTVIKHFGDLAVAGVGGENGERAADEQ
jgi:hypothetical protein